MMEEAPPPPYSENDTFSHPGRSPSARAGANDDTASVTESSSHGTPIYTPPETPRESHFNLPGVDEHRSITSAHSYFESRPTLVSRLAGQNFVASLAITEDASPDDFPYPSWASVHDTTEEDWQTFLNHLLPDHAARSNSQTIDRKLQAEDDAQSSKTERSIAEAQLGQIKSPSNLSLQPSHDIDTMVREWNDGFFGPRGVTIQRAPHSSRSASETPAFEDPPISVPQPQSQPREQEQGQEQTPRSKWNPFRPFDISNQGVRIGPLSIDNDRVAFGDSFEVDRNGVRWNGLSTNDLKFETDNGTRGGAPQGPGSFTNIPPGRGGLGEHPIGRGRGGRWWRTAPNPTPHNPRAPSPSAHSSASSSSSSSDSSIGSLPDWDDLRDSQLPITKQSISTWLSHPEQPVTKAILRSARSNIKAARNAPPPTNDPGWDVSKQALRQEVRSLLARLQDLKREQKRAARATRKERREVKRAAKRERRERRREGRRRGAAFDPFGVARRHTAPAPPAVLEAYVPPVPPVPQFNAPFGGFGFGGRGRGGGNAPRPWEAHVRAAREQAERARTQSAEQVRVAMAHADSVCALAATQAGRAREDALRQASAARAQAAAAVAGAGGSYSYSHVQPSPQPWRMWGADGGNEGVGNARRGFGSGNHSATCDNCGHVNKYERADALEAQLKAKTNELSRLWNEGWTQDAMETIHGKGEVNEMGLTKLEAEAKKLESEIRDLSRDVNQLRLEADEEMARKMAEEEGWHG
ncbi:uncharacterized protein GGS22DRAFT_161242 [Annulohypoxylon maeteangense]|uniref:uncharacterized protein n=1 Tax=Annulohypoxylon maeteangense TaxID=1927788 RepID=UPI0020078AA4|nr:uncharacterized protein GGS22DRAFT_161242 [Annulohypoxylon maeteangense]KAI0885568.1 hypothetical protein GGS22DRAFT_161242 [Annulohypoxylon maeteangense]